MPTTAEPSARSSTSSSSWAKTGLSTMCSRLTCRARASTPTICCPRESSPSTGPLVRITARRPSSRRWTTTISIRYRTRQKLQAPGTSYAPQTCYATVELASVNGPGCLATLSEAARGDYGLRKGDLPLLTTGATGIPGNSPDTRILDSNNLPTGPYPLVTLPQGEDETSSLYKTYGGSPVHRFYQMWQQLDCDAATASRRNPSGCLADLFPWVEITVSSGSNGKPPPSPTPVLKEGDIAMGFYKVAKGDAPYLTQLAREYTLNDNYHQPVMGGTFANQMMFGYADALYYADDHGNPATPDQVLVPGSNPPVYVNEIENPNPMP